MPANVLQLSTTIGLCLSHLKHVGVGVMTVALSVHMPGLPVPIEGCCVPCFNAGTRASVMHMP